MLDNLFICLELFLILGPPVIASYGAVSALHSGSYLRRGTKTQMVFLAPISPVVFVVTLLIWIIGLFVAAYAPDFFSRAWQGISSPSSNTSLVSVSSIAIVGLYWIIIRWYQKRCPLVLDFERRIYRTVDINSIKLQVQTGSWEEIDGIYVNRASAKGNVTYYVRLKWRGAKKLAGAIGGFSKQEKAEAFAEKMSKELGLPLVAAPMLRS